ncbi:hypothetical protein BDN72DRAFT_906850 [Pluteus cervinus]|uniref:Uncharacterized protein n=1 Tax=Pluteus cervinus TaxID=181527 RepID=A0ACD2ZY15_9AGAR|nr:hypothetical protein BDN72DRAFT_906850 [Pluteus cervinus]
MSWDKLYFPDIPDDFVDEENTIIFPDLPAGHSDMTSPTKRHRQVEPGLTRKRRKAPSHDNESIGSSNYLEGSFGFSTGSGHGLSTTPDALGSGDDRNASGGFDPGIDHVEESFGGQPEREIADQPIDWILFTEAVEDGICGFYQLTQDVFIVQGWDLGFHRPTSI